MTPSQIANVGLTLAAVGISIWVILDPRFNNEPAATLTALNGVLVIGSGACRSWLSSNSGNVAGGVNVGPDLKAVAKSEGVQ